MEDFVKLSNQHSSWQNDGTKTRKHLKLKIDLSKTNGTILWIDDVFYVMTVKAGIWSISKSE